VGCAIALVAPSCPAPLRPGCGADHAGARGRFDAVGQQPFAAFLANALTPAHQARRITRQLVAEVPLTTEVLPVRVLAPALDHVLVAERIQVFQVQQRGHQPRGQRRSPGRRLELRAPLVGKRLPVDQRGRLHRLVPLVDQVDQLGAKRSWSLRCCAGFGPIQTSVQFAKNRYPLVLIPANSTIGNRPQSQHSCGLRALSGRTIEQKMGHQMGRFPHVAPRVASTRKSDASLPQRHEPWPAR
jgi:hypothetical protein